MRNRALWQRKHLRPLVPAKAGTQSYTPWLWIPSGSAFTRVFDALCAGMSGALVLRAECLIGDEHER